MTKSASHLWASVWLGAGIALAPAALLAEPFRFAAPGDVVSFDPYAVEEVFTSGFLGNVYEGLVRRAPDLTIEPALATSWELLSPTHWRFKLREGVTFHDGTPFTADDVVFSAERVLAGTSDFKNRLPGKIEVVAVDDHTVDFITDKPNPILNFTWPNWYIMSRAWAEKHNIGAPTKGGDTESYATLHENGTGPYQLQTREPGVRTVLTAYDGWWGKATSEGNVTEVTFTPVPNAATRVAALLSGQLDLVYPLPVQDLARIEATPGASVVSSTEVRTMYLTMNQWKETLPGSKVEGQNPLSDAKVRAALAHAIDTDAIIARIMRGQASPATMMVAPGVNGFSDDFERRAYDPDRAKALLAEAGYADGFSLNFECSNDMYVNDEAICLAIGNMLSRVGIEARVNVQARAKFLENLLAPNMNFGMALMGTTPASLDGHIALYSLHMCPRAAEDRPVWAAEDQQKIVAGKSNFAGYCNPEVDRLANEIASETDQDKRNVLLHDAFALTIADTAYIPLYQSWGAWGVRDGVAIKARPDNVFDSRHVTVGK